MTTAPHSPPDKRLRQFMASLYAIVAARRHVEGFDPVHQQLVAEETARLAEYFARLAPPASAVSGPAPYSDPAEPVGEWAALHLVPAPDQRVSLSEAYVRFCEGGKDARQIGKRTFSSRLRERGYDVRKRSEMYIVDVRLAAPQEIEGSPPRGAVADATPVVSGPQADTCAAVSLTERPGHKLRVVRPLGGGETLDQRGGT